MFHAGGPLGPDDVYVERRADAELRGHLEKGEYAYVLGPTQLGKTSLALRTLRHFEAAGARGAYIDLNEVGTLGTDLEWMTTLVRAVRRQLRLPRPAPRRHVDSVAETPAALCKAFFVDEILALKEQVIVFFDEINSLLSIDQKRREDFLSVLRAVHLRRGTGNAERKRLTFCFLGIASPDELIRDSDRSPFNVAKAVRLDDFTKEEARAAFVPELERATGDGAAVVFSEIFEWTNGHPYMTQRVCDAVARRSGLGQTFSAFGAKTQVQAVIDEIFLRDGRFTEPNLSTVEKRLRSLPDNELIRSLQLYRRLLRREEVESRLDDKAQVALRLAGMVAEDLKEGTAWLRIRNRTFRTVFDDKWVSAQILKIDRPLTGPIARWIESGKHDDYLLRGLALEEARHGMGEEEPTDEEVRFLRACAELEVREQRRAIATQRTRTGLAASLAVVLLATSAGVGLYASDQARKNKDLEAALQQINKSSHSDFVIALEDARAAMKDIEERFDKEKSAGNNAVAAQLAYAKKDAETIKDALDLAIKERSKSDEEAKKERDSALALQFALQKQCENDKIKAVSDKQTQCENDKKIALINNQAECEKNIDAQLKTTQKLLEADKRNALHAKQAQCDSEQKNALAAAYAECAAKPCTPQPCVSTRKDAGSN